MTTRSFLRSWPALIQTTNTSSWNGPSAAVCLRSQWSNVGNLHQTSLPSHDVLTNQHLILLWCTDLMSCLHLYRHKNWKSFAKIEEKHIMYCTTLENRTYWPSQPTSIINIVLCHCESEQLFGYHPRTRCYSESCISGWSQLDLISLAKEMHITWLITYKLNSGTMVFAASVFTSLASCGNQWNSGRLPLTLCRSNQFL